MADERFDVTSAKWAACSVHGKPVGGSGETFMPVSGPAGTPCTFVPEVEVDVWEGGSYDHFAWYVVCGWALEVLVNQNAGGPPPASLRFGIPSIPVVLLDQPPATTANVYLYACDTNHEPPEGDQILSCHVFADLPAHYEPNRAPPTRFLPGGPSWCPTPGEARVGSTMSMAQPGFGMRTGSDWLPPPVAMPDPGYPVEDQPPFDRPPGPIDDTGSSALFYLLPVTPWGDPNALWTAFTYLNVIGGRKWTFSALPGSLSVQNTGTTSEDPRRECWKATVPTPSGATRTYYSDSSDGPFVSAIGYGTCLEKSPLGYLEKIGNASVRYDENKKLQKIEFGRAQHLYYHYSDYVEIYANTKPTTKMRCGLNNDGNVEKITAYNNWPEWGWVAIGVADITWSGDLITEISLAPEGTTTKFTYLEDGSIESYEDCGGRFWILRYAEGSD